MKVHTDQWNSIDSSGILRSLRAVDIKQRSKVFQWENESPTRRMN